MIHTQHNSPQTSVPPHEPEEKQKSSQPVETLPGMVEASVKGQDEPMEREHPKAPGALIWFSYPLALLVVLIIVAIAFMLFNN